MLLRYRPSDPKMDRRSNDLPESGRRRRYNDIRRREQLHTRTANEAISDTIWRCMDWTLQADNAGEIESRVSFMRNVSTNISCGTHL